MMIKDLQYQVVVVGAGPGGSVAARTLAQAGIKTLVLEKRQEIGAPKRCAEGVNSRSLQRSGITPDPAYVLKEIPGAAVYSPSGKMLEVLFKDSVEIMLERKIFEKYLARDAIRAGARYMVKTTVTGAIVDGGRIVGVRARHMGADFVVRCELVIAADGPDSRIARSAGIPTTNRMSGYHSGFQYEMVGLRSIDAGRIHIFFGNRVVPKGYIWIFPKGDDVANVGIGLLGDISSKGENARYYLDRFIDEHPEIFKDASPIEINAGGIPATPDIERFYTDGLMVVGDAAHQVNPIHGGGICSAIRAGRIAAEVGSKSIKDGDVSKERLSEYGRLWNLAEGERTMRLLKLRRFFERLDDEELETLFGVLSSEDILCMNRGDYKPVTGKLMLKAPKLLGLAKKFI